MSMPNAKAIMCKAELQKAKTQVEVGAKYAYYKSDSRAYTVLNLAFQEADSELCVIYQADYEERFIFIRPLASWLAMVEWQGKIVPRFTKL